MIEDIQNAFVGLDPDIDSQPGVAHFVFDEKLDFFSGHFPDEPILPGVFQIEMVRVTLEKMLNETLRIHSVKSAKFMKKVTPSEKLSVAVNRFDKDGKIQVKAVIKTGEHDVSKFTIFFTKQIQNSGNKS